MDPPDLTELGNLLAVLIHVTSFPERHSKTVGKGRADRPMSKTRAAVDCGHVLAGEPPPTGHRSPARVTTHVTLTHYHSNIYASRCAVSAPCPNVH